MVKSTANTDILLCTYVHERVCVHACMWVYVCVILNLPVETQEAAVSFICLSVRVQISGLLLIKMAEFGDYSLSSRFTGWCVSISLLLQEDSTCPQYSHGENNLPDMFLSGFPGYFHSLSFSILLSNSKWKEEKILAMLQVCKDPPSQFFQIDYGQIGLIMAKLMSP